MSIVEVPYAPELVIHPKTFRVRQLFRPKVPITIAYNRRHSQYPLLCLVDSGADYNVLPAEYGELIGIPIRKGEKLELMGIGGQKITSYRHDVRIYLPQDFLIRSTVFFSYQQEMPLLGRVGFFDKLTSVDFREKERKVILTYP